METRTLSRRHFVAGAAATGAALACVGAGATSALAEGGHIGIDARPTTDQIHTVCQGCPAGCGYTAYVVEDELGKVIGDASSPAAAGKLCARGYGYTQSAFSEANVKNPLRRKPDGGFQTISWDEAIEEITDELSDIMQNAGSDAIGVIYDGTSPTVAAYATRFAGALGTGNCYIDDVTTNINKAAAFSEVIGTTGYTPDLPNARLALLIDTSFADVTVPSLVADLQALRASGTPVMAIDPRLGTVASFADEWFAVNPGSELALLLAVCNELIRTNRYDKAYVAQNVEGFDAWSRAIADYTAIWAEDITGLQSYRIEQLASYLAEAAPAVAIQYGNGTIGADSYANSGETARVVCLLNTLLGTWGAKGGALLPFDYSDVSFDEVLGALPLPEEGTNTAFSPYSFPLGKPFGASAANGLELAKRGSLKALFVIDADVAYDYACIEDLDAALERVGLFVCITQEMTQTAAAADYVLPLSPYLECGTLPNFSQGAVAAVSIAEPVVFSTKTNALPIDVIIPLLAQPGEQAAFGLTRDQIATAQLAQVGLTLEGLQQEGSAELAQGAIARISEWPTRTGKVQCASAACFEAGLSALPLWMPPLQTSNIRALVSDDMNFGQGNEIEIVVNGAAATDIGDMTFRLISGELPVLGAHGYNTAELMDIAEKYDLDSIWINASIASALGIETGDEVGIYNDNASFTGKAFVTQRIVPTAVYIPSSFGHTATAQRVAKGVGANPIDFCDAYVSVGYGTLCTQEACVKLWKEGE